MKKIMFLIIAIIVSFMAIWLYVFSYYTSLFFRFYCLSFVSFTHCHAPKYHRFVTTFKAVFMMAFGLVENMKNDNNSEKTAPMISEIKEEEENVDETEKITEINPNEMGRFKICTL